MGLNARIFSLRVVGFRRVIQRCRLRDRISLCEAPSLSKLSIVSGFLWEPNKDFLHYGPVLKFQGSGLSQDQLYGACFYSGLCTCNSIGMCM